MILEVEDPKDKTNPMPESILVEKSLVYHGTSACFSHGIERIGFVPGHLPYSMQDVQTIAHVFECIGWSGLSDCYSVLRRCTLGNKDEHLLVKEVSFSKYYDNARKFATSPCGETIASMLKAIEEISDLFEKETVRERAITKLNRELEEEEYPPTREGIENKIERLSNIGQFEDQYLGLAPIYQKYSEMVKNHVPVVYAIDYRRELFGDKVYNAGEVRTNMVISPSDIFAKIAFPNGSVW